MDAKYLKKIGLYLISAIVAFVIIFYILYHSLDMFSMNLSTISAEIQSNKDVISADCYIFRDEEYVYSSYSGAVSYSVNDGEKVGISDVIAQVYSDPSGYSAGKELADIENKLDILNRSELRPGTSSSGTSSTDKKIAAYYSLVMEKLAEGQYSHVSQITGNLLIQMNRRQLITGERKDFSDLTASLESKKSSLTASLKGSKETVASSSGGYFFSAVDGYENIFTESAVNALTVSSFKSLISRSPESTDNADAQKIIGKIAKSYMWYIALPLSSEAAEKITIEKSYSCVFPYNYDTTLSLKAVRIATDIGSGEAVAVFSCGEMPEDFEYTRRQTAQIILSESKGYRIPETAVRIVDGFEGVYTLYGSTVLFKRIDIQLVTDGYCIVSVNDPLKEAEDPRLSDKDFYGYVDLYDRIIVSGKDLSHGMVFY